MGRVDSRTRLKQNFSTLKFLSKTNKQLRSAIICACDHQLLACICECIKNVMDGNVPLPLDTLKRLKPYRHTMEAVVHKRRAASEKKRQIVQNGGFLPILLPALIGVIGSLVGETIASNVTS